MGKFSNGEQGRAYENKYCWECINNQDCWIWAMHLQHMDAAINDEKHFLHYLIPYDKDEYDGNGRCVMFNGFYTHLGVIDGRGENRFTLERMDIRDRERMRNYIREAAIAGSISREDERYFLELIDVQEKIVEF